MNDTPLPRADRSATPPARPDAAEFTSLGSVAPALPAVQPPLTLHIDRLVLHDSGFSRRDGSRIEQAFLAEVQRLAGSDAAPAAGLRSQTIDRLMLGDLQVTAGTDPEQLGRQLAAALLGGLAT